MKKRGFILLLVLVMTLCSCSLFGGKEPDVLSSEGELVISPAPESSSVPEASAPEFSLPELSSEESSSAAESSEASSEAEIILRGGFRTSDSSSVPDPLRKLISPERIVFGLENQNSEQAVDKILLNFLKGRSSNPESTAAMLGEELLPTALEIIDGTVLLHVHCENIEEPTVLLGISPAGIVFNGIDNCAKAIFILLSPASDNPENHLQALSDIARFALSLKNSDILHRAANLSELQAELKKIK